MQKALHRPHVIGLRGGGCFGLEFGHDFSKLVRERSLERTASDLLFGNRTTLGRTPMFLWGLTFDMSGGAKGAKRPLGRPLDGGVRRQIAVC